MLPTPLLALPLCCVADIAHNPCLLILLVDGSAAMCSLLHSSWLCSATQLIHFQMRYFAANLTVPLC